MRTSGSLTRRTVQPRPEPEELSTRLERPYEEKADPLQCPYCGDRLRKYEVPHSAFEIDYWYEADHLYICFNDECPYFVRGWEWMWYFRYSGGMALVST